MPACGRPHCVCSLPTGPAFVLWSLRQWRCEADRYQRTPRVPSDGSLLKRGFAAAGMPDALSDFAHALDLLTCGARQPLRIQAPSCATMSHDEEGLLGLFGLAQGGFTEELLDSLKLVMGPMESIAAAVWIKGFAASLAGVGLKVAPPSRAEGTALH